MDHDTEGKLSIHTYNLNNYSVLKIYCIVKTLLLSAFDRYIRVRNMVDGEGEYIGDDDNEYDDDDYYYGDNVVIVVIMTTTTMSMTTMLKMATTTTMIMMMVVRMMMMMMMMRRRRRGVIMFNIVSLHKIQVCYTTSGISFHCILLATPTRWRNEDWRSATNALKSVDYQIPHQNVA